MAGRRTHLASLAGGRIEDVPGKSEPTFVRLPLTQLAPTPLNPRKDFGTPEQMTELGESMRRRQLQPVVVVSRASYLKLFPEHREAIGEVSHVITNGERRYRAARHVGLHQLEAVIREEVATSRQTFLDAVLSENIDRKNFDPIEEARGVEAMVIECGSATAAAEQFKRTPAWVSQRRVLLKLTPELQEMVSRRLVPVRQAREWGRLPPEQQHAAYEAWQQERTAPRQKPASDPDDEPEPDPPSPASEPARQADPDPEPAGSAGSADAAAPRPPAQRTSPDKTARSGAAESGVWSNPQEVNRLVRQHMTKDDRMVLAKLLLE